MNTKIIKEAVYGLGANGLDPAACQKIFEVKGRPPDKSKSLDVGLDDLDCYRKIIGGAAHFLNDGGFIALEIGINQAAPIKKIIDDQFGDVVIVNDLNGIERVVVAHKNEH